MLVATSTERRIDMERRLADRYWISRRAGKPDTDARNSLVEMHLPLIRWVAKPIFFANQQHSEIEELVNVGVLGLIEGLDSFDPRTGYRVSTYCTYLIRNAIHQHIRASRWNSFVPEKDYKALMKLHKALAKLPTRFDGHIDFDLLAETTGISEYEIHELFVISRSVISLETPTSRNGKQKLADVLSVPATPDESFFVAQKQISDLISAAIQELPADEAEAVSRHYLQRWRSEGPSDRAAKDRGLTKLKKSGAVIQAQKILQSVQFK